MRRRFGWSLLALGAMGCGSEPPDPAPPVAQERRAVASLDGVPIAFGSRGAGPTALVLVHDWGCDSSYWGLQTEAFVAGYRVVAIDLAGHGRSGSDRADWSVDAFAGDVRAVVEALDLPRVVLVGHSMGGPVVLAAAAGMPERVVGVVVVETLHDVERFSHGASAPEWIEQAERDFPAACDQLVRGLFRDDAPAELVFRVSTDVCSQDPDLAVQLGRLLSEYDAVEGVRAVRAPVRAINSDRIPTAVDVNRKYAPGFEAVVLDRVGHFPMLEHPDRFNAALAAVLDALPPAASGDR